MRFEGTTVAVYIPPGDENPDLSSLVSLYLSFTHAVYIDL